MIAEIARLAATQNQSQPGSPLRPVGKPRGKNHRCTHRAITRSAAYPGKSQRLITHTKPMRIGNHSQVAATPAARRHEIIDAPARQRAPPVSGDPLWDAARSNRVPLDPGSVCALRVFVVLLRPPD